MKNKGYAKFGGANKVYYGRHASGDNVGQILKLLYFWRRLIMAFIRKMVENLFLSFMVQVIISNIRS